MNRNSGNVSKTKKLNSGAGNNSKHNRALCGSECCQTKPHRSPPGNHQSNTPEIFQQVRNQPSQKTKIRKSFKNISDSSSLSSNRNSSAHSEDDIRVSGVYIRPQVEKNAPCKEQEEQVTKKLQAKVKELRHKLRVLEESVDSKDYSLGTIAREKDRAIGEIRRLERTNKLLRQQLNDERNHYLEEKEKFCEEMTKYKKKLQDAKSDSEGKKSTGGRQPLINQSLRWQLSKEKGDFTDVRSGTTPQVKKSKSHKFLGIKDVQSSQITLNDSQIRKPNSAESFHLYEGDDVSLQMAALRTENAKLRSIICERDERNYELCLRFLRMKHYKNDIKDRFQDLENEYLQVIANLMDKIDEARQEFNFIIDQKFKRPLHSTNAMYLQMVQKNSRMAFENASLRLENQCLKKELNKYLKCPTECDRKPEVVEPALEEMDAKSALDDNKDETKSKRIKKNVNFKEIQTIYERYLTFKTSDTDSNYMSKTSTTVPSNGSLVDPKSTESVVATQGPNNQIAVLKPKLQANALPDEILQKIFKRIDTSSCQTIDSGRSKEIIKIESPKSSVPERVDVKHKQNDKQEPKLTHIEVTCKKVQKEPIIIEHKSPPKITDSSSPCESRESVRFQLKEVCEASNRVDKTKRENYITLKRQFKQEQSLNNRVQSQGRYDRGLDRDSEGSSMDFPLRRITLEGRNRFWRQEPSPKSIQRQQQQLLQESRVHQFVDNCGLQEKLEFSDLELPTCAALSGVGTIDSEKPKTNIRKIVTESDDDDLGLKIGICEPIPPAVGSRSRSSNKVNLQDELMEAAIRQFKLDEAFRKKEKKFQSVQSRGTNKTYRMNKEDSSSVREQGEQCETHFVKQEIKQQRKPEASKRFSQRLFSTSPEQLKNILTESQFGPYRMAPIIVGHAPTEIASAFKYGEANNEILFQLVLPTSHMHSSIFSDNETMDKPATEKEVATCDMSPVHPGKSSNQTEGCASDVRIPISSLPTSNSTMEMVDSVAFERSNIMMRTLSAPGLLESNWLDPYTVCETRDCSTNT